MAERSLDIEISRAGSPRSAEISEMLAHQSWVRMHVDTQLCGDSVGSPFGRFRAMVDSILVPEKRDMFYRLLRFPLPTNAVTGAVFDKLSRVFEGRNAVHDYQFRDRGMRDDWEYYRQEVLSEPDVWKGRAWEYYKTEPNSVIVVDIDGYDEQGRPKPYFYWVFASDMEDFSCDPSGRFEYIVFHDRARDCLVRVDSVGYSVIGRDGAAVSVREHGLGFCPAKWFIERPVSIAKPYVKASPISKALSALDHYLWSDTSKKYLDAYGSYPIYSGYQFSCDYSSELTIEGEKRPVHCHFGVVVDDSDMAVMQNGEAMKCPVCGNAKYVGPGSIFTVPTPDETDGHDLRNPISILSVDTKSLKYATDELARQKSAIISMCVGVDSDAINEFSVSDKQVDANFETQSTILLRVKKDFEDAQKFADETCCLIRYGDGYEGCCINYGTEFYTLSTQELRDRYSKAKAMGAPESDLAALRQQIIETEYRNDPLMKQRMIILLDVEPLLGMTNTEATSYLDKGLVSADDVAVKVNFESLIRRFERENENVIDFASVGVTYKDKIERIKQTIYNYAKESK